MRGGPCWLVVEAVGVVVLNGGEFGFALAIFEKGIDVSSPLKNTDNMDTGGENNPFWNFLSICQQRRNFFIIVL